MAFIELKSIGKSFGSRKILSNIDLTLDEGEFVSIVGTSASGKTTLMKIACGLMPPGAGTAILDGKPVNGFSREASIVFQNYSLLPWLSALENVRLAVEAAFPAYSREQQIAHSRKYLEMVGLGAAVLKKPGQLSGGMRQRVAIARAFAVEPRFLFLDEPFGALDALTRATLQQELAVMCGAAAKPVTAVMITNSVDEAILLSDRIHALAGGTLTPGFPVGISRPRDASKLIHDPRVVKIRNSIADVLTSGRKTAADRPGRPMAAIQAVPEVA